MLRGRSGIGAVERPLGRVWVEGLAPGGRRRGAAWGWVGLKVPGQEQCESAVMRVWGWEKLRGIFEVHLGFRVQGLGSSPEQNAPEHARIGLRKGLVELWAWAWTEEAGRGAERMQWHWGGGG